MPQVQIELPDDVYKKIKVKAKENYQSLRGYITSSLVKQIRGEFIDTSTIPEDTIIKTKTTTQKILTPEEIEEQQKQSFLSLCKEMYGEKFYKEYAPDITREYLSLLPDNMYYNFAEEIPDRLVRAVYTMPIEKQKEYIIEMKHYLEEG